MHSTDCDANAVCGVRCEEIDLLEANRHAIHVTLHTAEDGAGRGNGLGGSFGSGAGFDASMYGPGANVVDTAKPFRVAAYFATDDGTANGKLRAVAMTLTGDGGASLKFEVSASDEYLAVLSEAIRAGMTPTASYWSSHNSACTRMAIAHCLTTLSHSTAHRLPTVVRPATDLEL